MRACVCAFDLGDKSVGPVLPLAPLGHSLRSVTHSARSLPPVTPVRRSGRSVESLSRKAARGTHFPSLSRERHHAPERGTTRAFF